MASFGNLGFNQQNIPGFLTGPHYERQKPIVNKINGISPDSQIRLGL
jgi:hypothetical protein